MENSLVTRLLVVDDDPTIREMLEMLLDSEGYEVTTASNGADALAKLPRLHPDVILLDMKMPVMDGWEFMDRYRTLPDATAHVVVFTAAQDTERRASEVGAWACVAKPFAIDDLLKVLEETAAA